MMEEDFLECMRDGFLDQYVEEPTRERAILDWVLVLKEVALDIVDALVVIFQHSMEPGRVPMDRSGKSRKADYYLNGGSLGEGEMQQDTGVMVEQLLKVGMQ
eukprot:g32822.t1